jgi:putative lipoprotein (rSAM/lipoprotein system)
MKKLFIHFSGKNIFKKIILLAGAIMGFSTSVVAQYGAPEAHYRITGFIKSKDSNIPIPNIKVRFSENEQSNYYSYPIYTDSTGKFDIDFYEYYGISVDKKKLKIIAEDEDGQQNFGDFLALEKWFILNRKSGGSKYDTEFENINIVMDYKGKAPCKTELPKDTFPIIIPSAQNIVINVDSAESAPDPANAELYKNNDTIKIAGYGEPPISQPKDFLVVYPNPSNGLFNIKIFVEKVTNIAVEIYDANSKLIMSESWGICEGPLQKQLSLERIAPGTYYMKIKIGNNFYIEKLIKQQ